MRGFFLYQWMLSELMTPGHNSKALDRQEGRSGNNLELNRFSRKCVDEYHAMLRH